MEQQTHWKHHEWGKLRFVVLMKSCYTEGRAWGRWSVSDKHLGSHPVSNLQPSIVPLDRDSPLSPDKSSDKTAAHCSNSSQQFKSSNFRSAIAARRSLITQVIVICRTGSLLSDSFLSVALWSSTSIHLLPLIQGQVAVAAGLAGLAGYSRHPFSPAALSSWGMARRSQARWDIQCSLSGVCPPGSPPR